MITYRRSTQPPPEPPVKFYKTVAISFFIVTVALLGIVIYITSKKATITVLAKEDSKPVNLTVTVEKEPRGSDSVSGAVTSAVFSWSGKYYPTGTKTVEGAAIGEVVIYNKTNATQPLVKTTRLLAPSGVLFRLADRVVVPAKGQITAAVYADQSGAAGDIGPSQFTIPGLSVDKQKVIFAESKTPMTGGLTKVGVLSAEDLNNAGRDYKEKVMEAFLASLNAADMVNNQIITSIIDGRPKSNHEAGEEVGEFNLSGTSTILMVAVKKDELDGLLNKAIASKVDPAFERILTLKGAPQLSVVSYDLADNLAQLSVSQEVAITLDANAEKLAAANFLNKRKDEIERYLLGLDHVAGVEVKFSPSWMLSSPGALDKIKVVVKIIK